MAKKATPKKEAKKAPKITDEASAKAYAKFVGVVLQAPYYVAEDGNIFADFNGCNNHTHKTKMKYYLVK